MHSDTQKLMCPFETPNTPDGRLFWVVVPQTSNKTLSFVNNDPFATQSTHEIFCALTVEGFGRQSPDYQMLLQGVTKCNESVKSCYKVYKCYKSVKCCYKVLQRMTKLSNVVTKCYKMLQKCQVLLQSVIKCYKSIKYCYKVLQSVTKLSIVVTLCNTL